MRKRNVAYLVDKLFWVLVLILPLICYVVYCFNIPPNVNTNDYMEIEYLQNTNVIKIDTGYYASANVRIVADISIQQNGMLFGCANGASGLLFDTRTTASSRYGSFTYILADSPLYDDTLNVRYVFDVSNSGIYQNDALLFTPNVSSYNSGYAICFYGANDYSTAGHMSVYSFKVYNGSDLVRYYVPVMRANDRQVGFYEKVSGDFIPMFNNVIAGDVISETSNAGNLPTLDYVMQKMGFTISTDNIVYKTLDGIFGANGVLPFVISQSALIYMTYFVFVELIHLAVDFLVFIPRLCHKWMGDLTNEN